MSLVRSLNPLTPLTRSVRALAGRAQTWSVDSQHIARRNALIANTALSERRREREDVDRFLAESAAPDSPGARAAQR